MVKTLSGSGFVPVSILLDGEIGLLMEHIPLRAVLGSPMARTCRNLSVNFHESILPELIDMILDWLLSPLVSPPPPGKRNVSGGRVLMLRYLYCAIDIRPFVAALIRVIIFISVLIRGKKLFSVYVSPLFTAALSRWWSTDTATFGHVLTVSSCVV
jgi:hypothetical protein